MTTVRLRQEALRERTARYRQGTFPHWEASFRFKERPTALQDGRAPLLQASTPLPYGPEPLLEGMEAEKEGSFVYIQPLTPLQEGSDPYWSGPLPSRAPPRP